MLTLYFRPGTCAIASRLALAEAGADHRVVDVSGRAELLAGLNPRGKVPVLDTGKGLLVENVAILAWIARTFPQAKLLPDDAWAQARCLSTLAWFASTVHIDYRRFLKPQVYNADPSAHAGISERGGADFRRDLDELDAMLAQGPWVQGCEFTLADPYALVFVEWAATSGFHDPGRRALEAWLQRMLARPAIRRTLHETHHPLLRLVR